jgi:hypothetical protein
MGFKRMLRWMVLALMPLFLFTGCGDLAPEMKDTRTVMLKMDLRQNYSLRGSLVHAAELSDYKTHLIMVLPSWEILYSEYQNYYSIFARGLMDTESNQVSLEIPLNTQMKIFAFLFKENYSEYDLFSEIKEVGYYGESIIFEIEANTETKNLGITLIQVPGTDNDTTAPQLMEVMAVSSPTDSTPEYTFNSSEAGDISYGGLCSSTTLTAYRGDNFITFNPLDVGTYSDCTISVTDYAANISNTLPVNTFIVQ